MTRPRARRRQRTSGVHPFSYLGSALSGQFHELQDFAASGPLEPALIAIGPTAASAGVRLTGSSGDAFVAHSSGILARAAGAADPPRCLHISDARPVGSLDSAPIWVRSDATPYEIAIPERRRTISITVPIPSLTFDVGAFDLEHGSAVDAPPIAIHCLRSLAEMVASDVSEWIAESPEAIDRYLIGVAGLILAAIFDERSEEFIDRDRAWLRTRVLALIDAQFHDPALAPATIALKFGISLRSLHRAFEGDAGVAEELRKRRTAHAAALLSEAYSRHLPVHEIARRSGFASIATFERSFTNAYEMSPNRYRAQAAVADSPAGAARE